MENSRRIIKMTKDFKEEFNKFKDMLTTGENFAFARYSDGEMFIMQNKTVVLAPSYFVTGDRVGNNIYTKEEQKEFLPDKHQFHREKLIESFQFREKNYFKGVCTKTDVGEENFNWQINLHGSGDEDSLTFANVLINSNYPRYVEEIVPLFKNKEIIYVVNEAANLAGLPFEIKKEFRIGSNCMINNYDTAEEVKKYIADNNIENHLILCSAASLSNFVIHECYKENQNNTFLDIGSSLNPYLDLEGWKFTRGYLTSYWMKSSSHWGNQVDEW
jgi:hypothetical protein